MCQKEKINDRRWRKHSVETTGGLIVAEMVALL